MTLGEGILDPGFAAACEADSEAAWREIAVEVTPHVFRLPMFVPEAAVALLADIDDARAAHVAAGGRLEPPNSMHEYGVVLADVGLTPFMDKLLTCGVRPVARHLFQAFSGDRLDGHHGYLVEYGRGADAELGFHADDSEVTLNLCLGDADERGPAFEGAELTLMGLRCELHRQSDVRADEVIELQHEPGTAILHAGAHRHRVEPIRSGRRRNLILWCRSSERRTGPRRLACTPWCGVGHEPS